MKKQKFIVRMVAILIAVLMAVSLLAPLVYTRASAATMDEMTVLFTHDLHGHLLPINETDGSGKTSESGGYARLATALKAARAENDHTITLDAGDFSMGSLFQSIYTTDATELRSLGLLGYDATTFGNHEFDLGNAGVAQMLRAALASGDPLPAIVQANYTQPQSAADTDIVAAESEYGIKDYTVIEKDGLRIAVFGIFGVDANDCSPNSGMVFEDPIETAKTVVAAIKANENPDMIICLSHSGTDSTKDSEDEKLAKSVDGIDLIISGHTHTYLEEPILVGNTAIVSCGEYCKQLGSVTLVRDGEHWRAAEYNLRPIDSTLADDNAMAQRIAEFKATVQREYLDKYDLNFDAVLTHNTTLFTPVSELYTTKTESTLGNLLADSYIYTVKEIEGDSYEDIALSVVPVGMVRSSLALGAITTSDAFNLMCLGMGGDQMTGYPLVSTYLTAKELEAVAEIDASVSQMMSSAMLFTAGAAYTYNPNRIFLDRVTDYKIITDKGNVWPDKDKLYRVVTDLGSAQMFSVAKETSYGMISIVPKDKNGNAVEDLNSLIITDSEGKEVKAWYAIANHLESFGADGTIPAAYAQPQGRKTISDESDILSIIASPGKTTWMAIGIVSIVGIAVCILLLKVSKKFIKGEEYQNRL